jgi:1-acyl-sn-glycerol-3-phosphate acyltransferase
VIFAYNHGSHFDGFFMLLAMYRLRRYPYGHPVYWKKTAEFPVVGAILRAYGGFPISHDSQDTAKRSAQVRAMVQALRGGAAIQIAPEGKRNDCLGFFHEGAALISLVSGCPVIPCSLCGVQPLFKQLPLPNRIWGRVKIKYHPPIDPGPFLRAGKQGRATQLLTKTIRDAVASGIDYPTAQEGEEGV